MGRTKPCLFIFLLTIVMLQNSTIAMNPKGFTLRMIHKDSEESPFYNPLDHLMTPEERFQTLIDQSKARARYIASQIKLRMNPDVYLQVVNDANGFYYAADVGIGTFASRPGYKNYYLLIDSGSDLTWLQCQGATQYFHQDSPLYPWEESQSYHPIPCYNHTGPACNNCNAMGQCVYRYPYVDSQVTSGVFAQEKFTVESRTRVIETFQGVMGCGFFQANFTLGTNRNRQKPDLIAGFLGLGRGPNSFINNLGPRGQSKFSYCFEKNRRDIYIGNTYLNFGADATIVGQVSRTRIVPTSFDESHYYLNLQGISVGGNRVPIPIGAFEINHIRGTGGCIIDSGAPITTMYKNIFDRVAASVNLYFERFGMHRAGFPLIQACYVPIDGIEYTTPTITFHFEQADYVVRGSQTWYKKEGNICLAITRSDSNRPAVLFGALQQVNKRILYNIGDMRLSFADANCSRGG